VHERGRQVVLRMFETLPAEPEPVLAQLAGRLQEGLARAPEVLIAAGEEAVGQSNGFRSDSGTPIMSRMIIRAAVSDLGRLGLPSGRWHRRSGGRAPDRAFSLRSSSAWPQFTTPGLSVLRDPWRSSSDGSQVLHIPDRATPGSRTRSEGLPVVALRSSSKRWWTRAPPSRKVRATAVRAGARAPSTRRSQKSKLPGWSRPGSGRRRSGHGAMRVLVADVGSSVYRIDYALSGALKG
jgi:hypothetical protein